MHILSKQPIVFCVRLCSGRRRTLCLFNPWEPGLQPVLRYFEWDQCPRINKAPYVCNGCENFLQTIFFTTFLISQSTPSVPNSRMNSGKYWSVLSLEKYLSILLHFLIIKPLFHYQQLLLHRFHRPRPQ